jgi:hypothetical protein
MKTKNKALIFLLCASLLCSLAGCRLAREDLGADARVDRLIGVFLSTEYLDLLDFEGYAGDNLKNLSGGDFVIDGDNRKYQGRLYAAKTQMDETVGGVEYVFEGVEGIAYFAATVRTAPESDSYIATSSGAEIGDSHMALSVGDTENIVTLEGTVYIAATSDSRVYYFNPVYQSADGSVYLMSGDSISLAGELDGEGARYSQTLNETYSETVNGETKTDSISITLAISTMFAPESIVVLQMGADSALLARAEYAPGALPETLSLQKGTAYLVLETHKRDTEGNRLVSRDIYSGGAENLEAFSVREDGICVKHSIELMWPE